MFQSLSLSGPTATIVRGYREVGVLSAWTLSANGATGTVSATLERGDVFQLTQRGLTVRVDRQKGEPWRWPVDSLSIEGRTITGVVRLSDEGAQRNGT